jgi:hypothetical protein
MRISLFIVAVSIPMLGDPTSEEEDGPKKSARSCYRAAL